MKRTERGAGEGLHGALYPRKGVCRSACHGPIYVALIDCRDTLGGYCLHLSPDPAFPAARSVEHWHGAAEDAHRSLGALAGRIVWDRA